MSTFNFAKNNLFQKRSQQSTRSVIKDHHIKRFSIKFLIKLLQQQMNRSMFFAPAFKDANSYSISLNKQNVTSNFKKFPELRKSSEWAMTFILWQLRIYEVYVLNSFKGFKYTGCTWTQKLEINITNAQSCVNDITLFSLHLFNSTFSPVSAQSLHSSSFLKTKLHQRLYSYSSHQLLLILD